jgi:hypothetical protein
VPVPRNARGAGAFRFAERRCWAQSFKFALGSPECNRRYGKYCAPLARSGKFGNSEDCERRLGCAQAMSGTGW